jgi:hypothetical protein
VVRSTAYGKTISGAIPMTAAHDVYRFTAHAGDIVRLNPKGCSLGFAHPVSVGQQDDVDIVSSSGKPIVLLGCEPGAQLPIPASGTYQAIVNYANVGPFSYHFVLQK